MAHSSMRLLSNSATRHNSQICCRIYGPSIYSNFAEHESSKTTERYAHVTKRGFDKLISPLNSLMSGNRLDPDKNQ
jgi:hypothetical protein